MVRMEAYTKLWLNTNNNSGVKNGRCTDFKDTKPQR